MNESLKIAVIGSCSDLPSFERNKKNAAKIGEVIARKKCQLLFGLENDTNSLPIIAALAAKRLGGTTIGFSHKKFPGDAAHAASVIQNTNQERGGPREFELISAANVIIAIGGGSGTLMEIAMAYQQDKPIFIMKGSGGWSDKLRCKFLDERKRIALKQIQTIAELECALEAISDGT